jgi:hypothetical protein
MEEKIAQDTQFVPENDVRLCGMITSVRTTPKRTSFTISCGYRGMTKDENGLFKRNSVIVVFHDKVGAYYAEKFKKGDKVIVRAVAQTVRNRVEQKNHLEFWGLSMELAKKNLTGLDYSNVEITGKIASAAINPDGSAVAYIHTRLEKTRKHVNGAYGPDTEYYKSITPVYMKFSKGSDSPDALTKGTWVSVEGHIYSRLITVADDPESGIKPERKRVVRIYADNVCVIGEVQDTAETEIAKDMKKMI